MDDPSLTGKANFGFVSKYKKGATTPTDSDINGGGNVDTFRIKIWDMDNGDVVVYDNQMGASDDSYDGLDWPAATSR